MRVTVPSRVMWLLGLAALLTACGGGSPFARLTRPQPESPAPEATSPEGALRALEWSWTHLDSARYAALLAPEFQFVFSQIDPYGSPYGSDAWTLDDEVITVGHLFHGGNANQPRASSIRMLLDSHLQITVDPRFPGSRWRKFTRSSFTLLLLDESQAQWHITGFGSFYLVRADSAGTPADTTHWVVERWEDETISPGERVQPAKRVTIGQLKALYR